MGTSSENILEVKNIEVAYNKVILALHDVSLTIPKGKIVALLGANGAGKSTTLKSISTMLASEKGEVTKGTIKYDGTEIKKQNPSEMVGLGMVQVLEGRRCFGHLTVEENIISGAYSRKLSRGDLNAEVEKIYGYFKRLKEQYKQQIYKVDFASTDLTFLENLPQHLQLISKNKHQAEIQIVNESSASDLIRFLIDQSDIKGFEEKVPNINEIFIRTVKGNLA